MGERGWGWTELRISSLGKAAQCLWKISNAKGAKLKNYDEIQKVLKGHCPPCLSPVKMEMHMRQLVSCGQLSFTAGADMETVITLYKSAFIESFEKAVTHMVHHAVNWGDLAWGKDEVDDIEEALMYIKTHCSLERELQICLIRGNHFSSADKGRFWQAIVGSRLLIF